MVNLQQIQELIISGKLWLLTFPLFALAISLFYNKVSEGEFRPIIPNLTISTLVQAGTIIATTLLLGKPTGWGNVGTVVAMLALILLLMIQIYIFQELREKTKEHIVKLLNNQDIKLKQNCIDRNTLQNIAVMLIEVDIRPNEFLASHKQKQREIFIQLLAVAAESGADFDQESLLLPLDERKRWAFYYRLNGAVSFIVFSAILAVYLLSIP